MAAADGIVLFLTGEIIYLLYVGWTANTAGPYIVACATAAVLTVTVLYYLDVYSFGSGNDHLKKLGRMLLGCAFAFLAVMALAFALKISEKFSRVWLFTWAASATSLITIGHLYFLHRLALSGWLSRNVVIIGATDQCRRLTELLESQNDPWIRILGIFEDRQTDAPAQVHRYSVLGGVNDLISYARKQRIDDIVIALPWTAEERILSIRKRLGILPIRSHLCPDMAGFHFQRYTYLSRVPILNIIDIPLSDWRYVLKMLEDRTLALLILVLILPVMGFIALCVKLDSPGPVFFRQKRYGFNNQLIDVLKFRTMYMSCQDDHAERLTTRDDLRVTRVGSFLRRTSVDELPQLINVLKGEMSIVGPRPHALKAKAEGQLYEEVVTQYASRHRVKPGITGWAQVNGWRGETDTTEKIQMRVKYDLYYIENWSFSFDMLIILRTISTLWSMRNAY